jgi:hypothetical protein
MIYFRLLILITILSVLSWFVLKLLGKQKHFGLVFLAWVTILLIGGALFYGISILVANANNS